MFAIIGGKFCLQCSWCFDIVNMTKYILYRTRFRIIWLFSPISCKL